MPDAARDKLGLCGSSPTQASDPAPVDRAVDRTTPRSDRSSDFRKLARHELLALAILVVCAGSIAIPRLPPGVCFGDSGDLQLASATLGIAHPPGYCGYVTLGFMAGAIPGVDPAYAVSLICLAAGVLALVICALIQVELGLHAWVACSVSLILVAHPRVWMNLVAPEVYAPSLAAQALAALLLIKHWRTGRRRFLWWSAIVLGFAVINRPPVALTLPFFVVAWWCVQRRWPTPGRRKFISLFACAALMIPSALYSFAYVMLRDAPTTAYNYIEEHSVAHHGFPEYGSGLSGKAERAVWLLSARQFRGYLGNSWARVRSKARWMARELAGGGSLPAAPVAILVLGGLVVAFRRNPAAAWLIGGMAIQSIVFVSIYRLHGQAANLLPLILSLAVCFGVSLSPLFPRDALGVRRVLAIVVLCVGCCWLALEARSNLPASVSIDAEWMLEDLDLATIPERSVILTNWEEAAPLRYARVVRTKRLDVEVITAHPADWSRLVQRYGDRPVFVTAPHEVIRRTHVLTPYRTLWSVGPSKDLEG